MDEIDIERDRIGDFRIPRRIGMAHLADLIDIIDRERCAALRQRIRNQPTALSQPDLPFDVTDQIDTVGSGGAAEPVLEGREHDRQLSPCSPWLHPLEERRWNDFF